MTCWGTILRLLEMPGRHSPDAVVITGPTASGKSRLALEIAIRRGGVIVNADAMQVYRDLSVLTARPSAADMARAPHALYGPVDAARAYSVGRYLQDVTQFIADRQDLRPWIFVGGTGRYVEALMNGLAAIPRIDPAIRHDVRQRAARLDARGLWSWLSENDPKMAARLPASDHQRLVRAIEVRLSTGRSLADWQDMHAPSPLASYRTTALVVGAPRRVLHARVAARAAVMAETGAVEEAARLTGRALDPKAPAMKAIGRAPFADYASGELTKEEAVVRTAAATRQYVKRQETFFRHRLATWHRLDLPPATEP